MQFGTDMSQQASTRYSTVYLKGSNFPLENEEGTMFDLQNNPVYSYGLFIIFLGCLIGTYVIDESVLAVYFKMQPSKSFSRVKIDGIIAEIIIRDCLMAFAFFPWVLQFISFGSAD